jgi:hypothetical protein
MDDETLFMRLRHVGFYAVSGDVARGRIDRPTVIRYLRRDAPKVTEPTRSRRLSLADDLERALPVAMTEGGANG